MAYSYNPSPQSGVGSPFGAVPGVITPPDPYGNLSSVYPNLSGTNAALSSDISAQLAGKLSPGTLKAMQDYEAQFSTASGMPGSNAIPGTLGYNHGVRDLGLTAEGQVKAGEAAYNSTIPTISRTQTVDPSLLTNIAETNALNASAPNPTLAHSYAQQLFDRYMAMMRGPGGGTAGGPGLRLPTSVGGRGGGGGPRTDALGFPIDDFMERPYYGDTPEVSYGPTRAGYAPIQDAPYSSSDFGDPFGEFDFSE